MSWLWGALALLGVAVAVGDIVGAARAPRDRNYSFVSPIVLPPFVRRSRASVAARIGRLVDLRSAVGWLLLAIGVAMLLVVARLMTRAMRSF